MKLRRLARDVDLIVSTGDFFPWKFNNFFLESGYEGYYEAMDGVGYLLYALLELDQVLTEPVDAVKMNY